MRRMKPALLASLLLGLATAVWASAPAPQSAAGFACTLPPTTVCNSCLYFGTPSAYQCTTFCLNGVLHRSCSTCGQGCNQ